MDKDLITNATSCINLIDIYPYSSSVHRYVDININNVPENIFQQAKSSYKIDLLEPKEKNETPTFVKIYISLGERLVVSVEKNKENSDGIGPLAHFEADFVGIYEITDKDNLKDGAIEEFAKFNAVHNVWPFWREFVFRSADSMHLPKPIIPLMAGIKESNEEKKLKEI